MKKNHINQNDIIDLRKLFKIILGKKIEFTLITFFITTALTSYSYFNQKPESYEISMNVYPAKIDVFDEFLFIDSYLSSSSFSLEDEQKKISTYANTSILEQFLIDILGRDELLSVIKKKIFVRESLLKSSEKDYDILANKLARLVVDKKEPGYLLKFIWHNAKEGIEILNDTIKITLTNFEESIFNQYEKRIKVEKKLLINKDLKTIQFLLEQRSIASELKLTEPIKTEYINMSSSNILINNTSAEYYLKGTKIIDKEVELIRNREYKHLITVEEELNLLRNTDIKWIDYNINLVNVKSLNKYNFILILLSSALFGLLISLVWVFIVGNHKVKQVTRNTRAN